MTGRLERGVTYGILAVFTVLSLTPVLGILSSALAPRGSLDTGFSLPSGLHFGNFADAFSRGHFGSYLANSVLVAAVVVVVSGLLSVLAAYAFGVMRFPGASLLFYLFVAGLTLPQEALVVPLYFDLRAWHMTDSYAGLILPQAAQSLAFGVFWMRTYFRQVPRSVIEAARIDGASTWTTLWRILLPMGRPAVSTMLVMVFMWTWNEFLIALVMVSDERYRTVPLGLAFFQGQHGPDTALLAAGSVLVALPVVVVYVALQRRFIAGILGGAVKE